MEFIEAGLGWRVWGGGLLLSLRLISYPLLVSSKRVLELGSGCGLCGLLTAMLGASEVTLSDYNPSILSNLRVNISLLSNQTGAKTSTDQPQMIDCDASVNIRGTSLAKVPATCSQETVGCVDETSENDLNKNKLPASGKFQYLSHIRVRMLDWFQDSLVSGVSETQSSHPDEKLAPDEKFDCVIGSDLIYDASCLQPLATVISRRLSYPSGEGFFVVPVREKNLLASFLNHLQDAGLIPKVEQILSDEWDICRSVIMKTYPGECTQNSEGMPNNASETFKDADYYEGGYVAISVRHNCCS